MSPTLQSLIAYCFLCRAEALGSFPIHLLMSIGVWTVTLVVKLYGCSFQLYQETQSNMLWMLWSVLEWKCHLVFKKKKHWFPDHSPLRVLDELLYFVGRMFPPLNSAATIRTGGTLREGDLFCVEHITPGVSTMLFSSSLILLCNG